MVSTAQLVLGAPVSLCTPCAPKRDAASRLQDCADPVRPCMGVWSRVGNQRVHAAIVLRAFDYGYSVVQIGKCDGKAKAPLTCFFQMPDSCSGTGRGHRADSFKGANSSTLHALLTAKVRTVKWVGTLKGFNKALPLRVPAPERAGLTVTELADRLHVPTYYIFSHVLSEIFNLRVELVQSCGAADSGRSSTTGAMHVRAVVGCTGKVTRSCDGRSAAPLPVYLHAWAMEKKCRHKKKILRLNVGRALSALSAHASKNVQGAPLAAGLSL